MIKLVKSINRLSRCGIVIPYLHLYLDFEKNIENSNTGIMYICIYFSSTLDKWNQVMWVCKGSQFLLSTFTDKMISPVLGVWLSRPYTILLTNKFFLYLIVTVL